MYVLAEYITPCKADKTLDACGLQHGNAAIQRIADGKHTHIYK